MLTVGFGLKNFFYPMKKYKVMFSESGPMVTLCTGLSDVQACQFAINLHQSSNVPHTVFVFGEDVDSPLLLLERK